jgi:YidC/Oxa1 family membrane protein insertase
LVYKLLKIVPLRAQVAFLIMQMDRNSIIGIILISGLLYLWVRLNTPSAEQLARDKFVRDSTASAQALPVKAPAAAVVPALSIDSVSMAARAGKFGVLASAAVGTEQTFKIKNELVTYTFSNRGGRIIDVQMANYDKITEDSLHVETKTKVRLLEDANDRFEYLLSLNGQTGTVSTQDLYFTPKDITDKSIGFSVQAANGGVFEQKYSLKPGEYALDYEVATSGDLLQPNQKTIPLHWVNHLDRIEMNTNYERNYTAAYFRKADGGTDHCSCTDDDTEELADEPMRWVGHSQQFFTTALIATKEKPFAAAKIDTKISIEGSKDLKIISTDLSVPLSTGSFKMSLYSGPNEFKRLRAFGVGLEDVIAYGSSILGTINRWVIRPAFEFLNSFIGNAGLVIILLTLLVKAATYPLSYRMILSQAKMATLKPRIEKLKEKLKDDQQQLQVETMKMYGEFGVNPLGGCFPMIAQMPIWLALYRFFPAAIEFRQASFLWIKDLTNFETFIRLPFDIPFIGATIGLFALLWTITTLIYSYYSTKDMDFSANPAMKYMQYITPFIFFPIFNTTAAGLSYYMAMSNLINIGQTVVTRKFLINNEKLLQKLEANKATPKKKGIFRQKMEEAMAAAEEQKKQQEKAKKK